MQTPAQVAKSANVTVGTIRNWTRDYGDLLSPEARGENGPRRFNDEDVSVILAIAALRKSGVPPSEIAQHVSNHEVPPVVDANVDTPQSPLQSDYNALQSVQVLPQALQIAHNALQSRVEAVERALQLVEQRQAARVDALVTGIVLGGAAVLIVVALVLALGQ